MRKIKAFIKKYFSSLVYFYRYLGVKIFIAFFLSVFISFLDALGLTMFVPLLQVLGEEGTVYGQEMGKLSYVINSLEALGISLNIISVLLWMIVFFSLKGIAFYLGSIYRIYLQEAFIRKIRLKLLNGLNAISYKSFVTSDVGRIQNTMTGEVDRVSRSFTHYFQTFELMVMVLVYIGFAFAVDPKFALLVSIGGALTNFLYRSLYKHTKGASRKLTSHNSDFQGQIIQHIAHFKYLNATGTVHKYTEKLTATIYRIESARRKIGKLSSIGQAAREPLMVVVIATVILLQIKLFGGSIGAILVSLLFFFRALQSLTILQSQWNSFLEYSGSLENMQDFQTDLNINKEDKSGEKITSFKHQVQIENVDFYYGSTKILDQISLSIYKNQSLAFVGESGSGKTTLVNLIAGLLPQSAGSVKIDDIPLSKVDKESYQKRIGYVSQDPVIFNDTIFNNVTLWGEATSENLERFHQAVKQAALESFLKGLPAAEQTELGNNGINLSGGQKQRISIARELYKDIDILILDEATSALDSETERSIQKSLDALKGKYTLLSIAHRLSTIRNADQVVFMDKGRIVAIDSFEGLVKSQERFKKMVELQEL